MPIIIEPARRGAFIRCTTTRIAFRTHWNTSPILCARLNLKIIVHCTIGFWSRSPTPAFLNGRCRNKLNLRHTVMSKRKLAQLVEAQHVDGWDDPRLPTLAGLRRRGFTPSSIRLFCERIGISKADAWIDIGVLEQAL